MSALSVPADDPYMSYAELAEDAGVCERTLRRAIRDPGHPLPFHRVRGRILFKKSEFDRWSQQAARQIGAPDVDRIVRAALKGRR